MKEQVYKMDLHVHTPSSFKCYKGSKDLDEYVNIIREANHKNIKILAITDHNTVKGYLQLIKLKNSILQEYELFQTFIKRYAETIPEVENDGEEIKEKKELFDNVVILPGVEITLNPGVHMVVIAKPGEEELLTKLLNEIGYHDISPEDEIVDQLPDMDIHKFLEIPYLSNFIVIAPHVDSDKGIFNNIPKGDYRASIFKSSAIAAFTCNSINQQNNIEHLLANDKKYKRDTPWTFISASDAHKVEDIGSKVSYIKLSGLTFNDIKRGFENPSEQISNSSNSNMINYIKQEVNKGKTFVFDGLDNQITDLPKVICACLNSNFSSLVLGVSHKNLDLIGIKMNKDDFEDYYNKSLHKLSSRCMMLSSSLSIEQLGNGRIIATIDFIKEGRNLWYEEETQKVYNIYNGKVIEAKIDKIEKLIIDNTLFEVKRLENNRDASIDELISKLNTLRYSVNKYELMLKINSISLVSRHYINISSRKRRLTEEEFTKLYEERLGSGLGDSDGKLHYLLNYKDRNDSFILRYSCPSLDTDIFLNEEVMHKSGIVICKEGGCHLVNDDNYYLIGIDSNYLFVEQKKDTEKMLSLFSLIGWLKSSVLVWYCLNRYQTNNLYLPKILLTFPIPQIQCLKPGGKVEKIVKEIIQLEKEFLIQSNLDTSNGIDDDILDEKVDEHNRSIAIKTNEIDKILFEELKITEEEIKLMKDDILANKLFNIL